MGHELALQIGSRPAPATGLQIQPPKHPSTQAPKRPSDWELGLAVQVLDGIAHFESAKELRPRKKVGVTPGVTGLQLLARFYRSQFRLSSTMLRRRAGNGSLDLGFSPQE